MTMRNSHLFALYYPESSQSAEEEKMSDKQLVHRIKKVLRLRKGEQCILFDRKTHLYVELMDIMNSSITVRVVARKNNKVFSPSLTLLLPLLRKDALEQAVYATAEMGVTALRLVTTAKSRQHVAGTELIRLKRIIIAAAEQSKQFAFPEIIGPAALDNQLFKCLDGSSKVFADPAGVPLFDVLRNHHKKEDLLLMIGPEGDLTSVEKDLLFQEGFSFCALTPTILRSFQAASLLVGMCRTYFS